MLQARHIIKRFGNVTALKGVSFDLHAGEIHALCGENGAGKSTLIKILSGIYPHGEFEGELLIDGTPAHFAGIADSERAGIGVIYQELALVGEMTVAENIFLGREPRTSLGLIDWDRLYSETRSLFTEFHLNLEAIARVGPMGVGQKQLVEIAKALAKRSRIMILDEPTAALSENEVRTLLEILGQLRQRGMTMIYISHKLEEIFQIADRITVLRDGESIVTQNTRDTDREELIRHIAGREISQLFPKIRSTPGGELLRIEGLSVQNAAGAMTLENISLSVRAGEVLGLGGLIGAGRTELLMHLFAGWGRRTGGNILLHGKILLGGRPGEAIARGLVLVTEDRKRYGLHLDQDIEFNLSLSSLDHITHSGWINHDLELSRNREMFSSLKIKAASLDALAGNLSGGNQQKVVLGKALLTSPHVVLLDEPTRGIDVGAKLEIYHLINRLTSAGKAVILVSSELPELMGMSDRILMMRSGRLTGEFDPATASQEELVSAAMH
ncbi:MAG: sugar ABC transporter ATP-binding protein [Verrucomicrobiae bacterium]|nr:sugar ABC transporter ATP-binding protein [Verrucomicrobiae bacterium]